MAAVAHRPHPIAHRPHNAHVEPAQVSEEHQKGRAARERQRHRPESKGNMAPAIIAGVLGIALVITLVVWIFMR